LLSRISSHIRGNVVGYLALFLVVTGGTAYATHPGGADTISTEDIINGQVQTPDIGAAAVVGSRLAGNSVNSSKAVNNSLTGDDINESTLAGVNAATTDGASVCRTNGTLTMAVGAPAVPVCANGALRVDARCTSNDGAFAELVLHTSADDTFVSSLEADDPDLDIAESPAILMSVGDFVAALPGAVEGGDTSFAAGHLDGSQLAGSATIRATTADPVLGDHCEFVVGATT
jgi:hypothetical protein